MRISTHTVQFQESSGLHAYHVEIIYKLENTSGEEETKNTTVDLIKNQTGLTQNSTINEIKSKR